MGCGSCARRYLSLMASTVCDMRQWDRLDPKGQWTKGGIKGESLLFVYYDVQRNNNEQSKKNRGCKSQICLSGCTYITQATSTSALTISTTYYTNLVDFHMPAFAQPLFSSHPSPPPYSTILNKKWKSRIFPGMPFSFQLHHKGKETKKSSS